MLTEEQAREDAQKHYGPGGFVTHINMLMMPRPEAIPDTPADIAARAVHDDPEFHTLPQADRDQRIRDAINNASWRGFDGRDRLVDDVCPTARPPLPLKLVQENRYDR